MNEFTGLSELDLAVQTVTDKTRILRLMVEQHSQAVFRLAWKMVGNESDAEEVVQETFLRAWRGLDGFQGTASSGTWLYRIATNCALDLLRSRKRQGQPEEFREIAQAGPSQEDQLYHGQVRRDIEKTMRRMAPKERSAFALRHFAECSIKDISEILGIKPNAVKQAIFRAVRKLKTGLEPK